MKARLITRKTLANTAAERFGKWIEPQAKRSPGIDYSKQFRILGDLRALGPNPTPEDVECIIGNAHWTCPPNCDGCDARGASVVQVGEEQDCESSTANLCENCIHEAFTLSRDMP